MFTLKSLSAFGILPALDLAKVPGVSEVMVREVDTLPAAPSR
jgi:hypothetical protein